MLCLLLEIPVFHFLNARITFGNINATVASVSGVHSQVTSEPGSEEGSSDDDTRVKCSIDVERFSPPSDYVDMSKAEQHSSGFNSKFDCGKQNSPTTDTLLASVFHKFHQNHNLLMLLLQWY